jgi:nitrogen fixation protein NifZ
MRPRFEHGDEVRVLRNVRNDGTFPGLALGAPLVRRGSTGYVCDLGLFLQDQIIYTVHFLAEDKRVGCREEELQLASEPWTASRFEFRDKVATRLRLGAGGRVLVERGEVGEVIKVLRDTPEGVGYHVVFAGCNTLLVPESALEAIGDVNSDADLSPTLSHSLPA